MEKPNPYFSIIVGITCSKEVQFVKSIRLRTVVAGEIVAKYVETKQVSLIVVFGTGTMSIMQVQILQSVTNSIVSRRLT